MPKEAMTYVWYDPATGNIVGSGVCSADAYDVIVALAETAGATGALKAGAYVPGSDFASYKVDTADPDKPVVPK